MRLMECWRFTVDYKTRELTRGVIVFSEFKRYVGSRGTPSQYLGPEEIHRKLRHPGLTQLFLYYHLLGSKLCLLRTPKAVLCEVRCKSLCLCCWPNKALADDAWDTLSWSIFAFTIACQGASFVCKKAHSCTLWDRIQKLVPALLTKQSSCRWCLGHPELIHLFLCYHLLGSKLCLQESSKVKLDAKACAHTVDQTKLLEMMPRTPRVNSSLPLSSLVRAQALFARKPKATLCQVWPRHKQELCLFTRIDMNLCVWHISSLCYLSQDALENSPSSPSTYAGFRANATNATLIEVAINSNQI